MSLEMFLQLPIIHEMASEDSFFHILKNKINKGLSFLQIREKNLSKKNLITFIGQIKEVLKKTDVKIVINSSIELAYEFDLDGVHLTSKQLYELRKIP